MSYRKAIICFAFLFLTIGGYCQDSLKTTPVILTAEIQGYPDSTLFFIQYNGHFDSVYLCKQRFRFQLTKSIYPKEINIKTKSNEYLFFWVDNKNVHLVGEKKSLVNTKITGSKTQLESESLIKSEHAINKRLDSLQKAYISGGPVSQTVIKQLLKQIRTKEMEFIENNPDSYVSVNHLRIYSSEFGRKSVEKLYDHLSGKMKISPDGILVSNFLAINKEIPIGGKYVDLIQYDSNNNKISLSSFEGKVLLLDFWAAWCHPCRVQNKYLSELYMKYKDKGFEIISVTIDTDRNEWVDAIKKDRMNWVNLSEYDMQKSSATDIYGIYKYPSTFLIDKHGIIVAMDLENNSLDSTIGNCLKQR